MPLKVKISEFAPVDNLNAGDLIPIIRTDSSGPKTNKNVTVLNLEQHILGGEDGSGIQVSGSSGITGSLSITNDITCSGNLTILGAIVNTLIISSSQVDIDDNRILLNAFSPYQRYTGIDVYDSGSNTTSSFLWDSLTNEWGLTNLNASGSITASAIKSTNISGSNITASYLYVRGGMELGGNYDKISPSSISGFFEITTNQAVKINTPGGATTFNSSGNISASGDITMSGILVTGNSRIPIGEPSNPSDTVFTDGFFDTFTKQTKLADAIDEISEAFLDLAPPKAGVLTGTTLSSSGTNLYSAFLAGGLNPHWYSGSSQSGSLITTFINQPFLKLSTTQSSQPTASFFRSGKYSDFTVLTGGVTSSFSTGSNPVVVASSASILKSTGSIVSSSLAIGTGLLPSTFINGTNRYNIFWAQTSASISHSLTITGSLNYALGADNSAGITNTSTYWFASSSTDYPNQSLSGVTCSIATPNLKYMSGMTYLSGSSTVKVSLTANNLHYPVYNTTPISFVFSNPTIGTIPATGSSVTPNFDTIINLDTSVINSAANLASPYGTFPTLIITATKPGKSNVSSAATTVYPRPVNNYGSPASVTTNGVNTITEKFLDEYYRLTNLQGLINQFPSASSLASTISDPFPLQVQNGRLIAGATGGDYSSFTHGSSGTSYANYFRSITIPNSVQSGQLTMSLVSPFTTIQKWGTGQSAGPEIALIKTGEVLTIDTATNIYDLGRSINDNDGNIKGAHDLGQSTLNLGRIKWTFGTQSTGTTLILWIRYKVTAGYITDFTLKT